MIQPIVPQSYEDWKHCITALCRIPLTSEYIESRIAALADRSDPGTERFARTWGEDHLARVQSWFFQAQKEFAASDR